MTNCCCCKSEINAEKEGNVSLPCGHTFHPICYLYMYEELEKDDLPYDAKHLGLCAICVMSPDKIVRGEEESVLDNMDVKKYNTSHAMLIVTHNTVFIKKHEATDEVANKLLERHKPALKIFKTAAKKYGAKRWKLERLINKRRAEILAEVKRMVDFTITQMTEAAYKDIIASEEYLEFVKVDREYVKHLNGLQFIDPIQYFQKDVITKIVGGMGLNSYTQKSVLSEMMGEYGSRYNRSNLRSYLKPTISVKGQGQHKP
jgi:hypothetical protein